MLTFSKFSMFNAMNKTFCLKAHTFHEVNDFMGPEIDLPYSLDDVC